MKVLIMRKKRTSESAAGKRPWLLADAYKEIDQIDDESSKALPVPPKFPATLQDFYRLVVKARTVAHSQARLRKFLRTYWFEFTQEREAREHGLLKALFAERCKPANRASLKDQASNFAAKAFEVIAAGDNTGGFFARDMWEEMALSYLEWWKHQQRLRQRTAFPSRSPRAGNTL